MNSTATGRHESVRLNGERANRLAALGVFTALFLGGRELAIPALGLAKPPHHAEPQLHAHGFLAHLLYGVTLELVCQSSANE